MRTDERKTLRKHARAPVLAAMALGLFGLPVDAQEAREMKLEDAGFVMRAADTPKKVERVKKLPPHKFVARNTSQGRYYLYYDPVFCKCVFAGGETAMQTYRDLVARGKMMPTMSIAPRGMSPEHEIIRDMDADDSDLDPDDILHFRF